MQLLHFSSGEQKLSEDWKYTHIVTYWYGSTGTSSGTVVLVLKVLYSVVTVVSVQYYVVLVLASTELVLVLYR